MCKGCLQEVWGGSGWGGWTGWDIKVTYFGIKASAISAPSLAPNLINNTITSTTWNGYISILFFIDRNWFDWVIGGLITDYDWLSFLSENVYNDNSDDTSIIWFSWQFSWYTANENWTYNVVRTFNYWDNNVQVTTPIVLNIATFTSSFNQTIAVSQSYNLNTVITKNAPWTWPFTYSINTAPTGTSILSNTLTTWATTGTLIINIVDSDGRTSTATGEVVSSVLFVLTVLCSWVTPLEWVVALTPPWWSPTNYNTDASWQTSVTDGSAWTWWIDPVSWPSFWGTTFMWNGTDPTVTKDVWECF